MGSSSVLYFHPRMGVGSGCYRVASTGVAKHRCWRGRSTAWASGRSHAGGIITDKMTIGRLRVRDGKPLNEACWEQI